MKLSDVQRRAVDAVIGGSFQPAELRCFVELCFLLAFPHIRRRIRTGKINISALGMTERDAVYDCIADLFRRDGDGRLPEVEAYFNRELRSDTHPTEDLLLPHLRRLVIGKVNNNLIRLHGDADPALARILRNMKLGIEKGLGLSLVYRFNDAYIAPDAVDHLLSLPPYPDDELRRDITGSVLVHDNIPTMLRKLRDLLAGQHAFQRLAPFVPVGLHFKEVYAVGWEQGSEVQEADRGGDVERLDAAVDVVCRELRNRFTRSRVDAGTMDAALLEVYCRTLGEILRNIYADQHLDGSTYYESLAGHLPGISKAEYDRRHKSALEYLVKLGKRALARELGLG